MAFEESLINILFISFAYTTLILYRKFQEKKQLKKEVVAQQLSNKTIHNQPTPIQLRKGNTTIQIPVKDISYFYLENSIVYLKQTNGETFAVLETLNDILKKSEQAIFFTANRQFIITKNAVKSWQRTSTRKLSLELQPTLTKEVTISKNKAPAFLDWINQEI